MRLRVCVARRQADSSSSSNPAHRGRLGILPVHLLSLHQHIFSTLYILICNNRFGLIFSIDKIFYSIIKCEKLTDDAELNIHIYISS